MIQYSIVYITCSSNEELEDYLNELADTGYTLISLLDIKIIPDNAISNNIITYSTPMTNKYTFIVSSKKK